MRGAPRGDRRRRSVTPSTACGSPAGRTRSSTQLLPAYGGPGRTSLTFEPTYVLHTRLSWLTHTTHAALRLPDDFVLTVDQVDEARRRPSPTSSSCARRTTRPGNAQPVGDRPRPRRGAAAARSCGRRGVRASSAARPRCRSSRRTPNVAVVRTFSKAFAMAGARLGYVLADPAVVEDLQRVRLPYHLSALAQAAGLVALRHRDDALAAARRDPRPSATGSPRRSATIAGVTVVPERRELRAVRAARRRRRACGRGCSTAACWCATSRRSCRTRSGSPPARRRRPTCSSTRLEEVLAA